MKHYTVWHEKGGFIQVYAKDEEDAKEKYYITIEGFFNIKDRERIIKPTHIELSGLEIQHCKVTSVEMKNGCLDVDIVGQVKKCVDSIPIKIKLRD